MVSTASGCLVFLGFLLFAAQILVHLFATSFVNAAAFDAARVASGAGARDGVAARAHGLDVLGAFAARVSSFTVDVETETVTVRVLADSPALLPRAFGSIMGVSSIDHTVTLRREQPTCPGC